MNMQINVRMPQNLIKKAKDYAECHGFGNVQELIKESLREKLFEKQPLTKEELMLVKNLAEATEENSLWGNEEDLFRKLKRR